MTIILINLSRAFELLLALQYFFNQMQPGQEAFKQQTEKSLYHPWYTQLLDDHPLPSSSAKIVYKECKLFSVSFF